MFGYVKPLYSELKVREYELYKSVYCGLCHSLGKKTGCASRLSLSYDFVFLALVRMSLSKEAGTINRHRCIAHPTKKRPVTVGSKELDICARLSSLLTYYKLIDDINDERGFKRLTSLILLPFAKKMKKKANIETLAFEIISDKICKLSQLEKAKCQSIDEAAEPFGELLSYICSYNYEENSKEARIAAQIGRHIGRFVYIIDAVDDFEKDIKSGSYNPFCIMYNNSKNDFIKDIPRLRQALTMELVGLSEAALLIDFDKTSDYGEILKNIIYLGLPEIIKKTLAKYICDGDNSCRQDGENSI